MLQLGTHHWSRVQYPGFPKSRLHNSYSQVCKTLLPVIAAERMSLHLISRSVQIITRF